KRSVNAKYMWLMCARPPEETVESEQRGEMLIRRCAATSRRAEEKRRALRSTVTPLVWPARESEGNRRRNGDDLSVTGLDQLPAALMHHPVMPMAEQDLVFDLSAAAVQPMHDVMSVTCRRRSFAAGPLAVFIPRDQSPAARTLDRSLAPPDVDHHRVLHQDPAQAGVAGPALHSLGGDGEGELALRAGRSDEVEQRLERARDLHLDPGLARGELDQRVSPTLGRIAIVVSA